MADKTTEINAVPPTPPKGEIVNYTALLNTQFALYRNTLAFGGTHDPSTIWSSMLRDDGSAMLYYRELEEKDVDIANALHTLKGSVLERNWTVEPADKNNTQAVEIATWTQAQLDRIPNLDQVLDNMLDATAYGFSVQEMIFDVSEGQAQLEDIRDCPQELFLFGNRYTPQIGPMQFLDSPYAGSGVPVPEEKFLIYTYRGRSRIRMGRPMLREVFWPSWFKRNMLRMWAQYAEKGPGTVVVRYDSADNKEEAIKAAEIARALREEVAVAVPRNFEYDKELLTIARALNPDVFEHFFKAQQLDIVRLILGETLTSFGGEDGKGTQALGAVHADTLETRSLSLCRGMQSVLTRQLLRPLVLWNYGPNAPMPEWHYDIEEKEDLTERLGIDSGLYEMGLPISDAYFRQRYGVPVPEAGETVLSNTSGAAPAVTIRDVNSAAFAETTLGRFIARQRARRTAAFAESATQANAEREMAQFDALVGQLQDESLGLMKERVGGVTHALRKTGVQ
jgi:phage gp29-like protein